MPKAKDQDPRLSYQVYEQLLERILSGHYRAGSPISELALTRELGVSRTPVHEAMLQLENDGLILQSPNCRPVVVGLTSRDIQEIFEMRLLLEGEAAALAAARPAPKMVTHLEKQLRDLNRHTGRAEWVKAWVSHDEDFHRSIARASGSKRLAHDIGRYRMLHRGFNTIAFDESHAPFRVLKQARLEHQNVLKALAAGRPDAAREAMRVHIRAWQEFFANLFGTTAQPTPAPEDS